MVEKDITKQLTEDSKPDRVQWVNELAEVEQNLERRVTALTRRVVLLERKNFLPEAGEERTMLLGLGLLVLVQVLPVVIEGVVKWARHSGSSSS